MQISNKNGNKYFISKNIIASKLALLLVSGLRSFEAIMIETLRLLDPQHYQNIIRSLNSVFP
jgi:hypothetical protein